MSIEPEDNPLDLFRQWFDEAERNEPDNPNAMSLATVGADGAPSIRMVLLKGVDDEGFVFYTNLESRKGGELRANDRVALCFHWKSLRRQVRIEGTASPVAGDEADAYFASRPRGSQIGAWASAQSRPMNGKAELLKQVASHTAKFGIARVPRPPHWSGFRIVPDVIEFWREGQFRLHDRLQYRRTADGWTTQILYP
jgi:pyridoxamine 5'-phosphate oxidase